MQTIEYREGGVWLPECGLWLDPQKTQTGPLPVLVSHAHADHVRPHREVILSLPTARLVQVRLGGQRQQHVLEYGERRLFETNRGRYHLTLLPAGHILGSAMAWVETERGSMLYSGDFKLRASRSAEANETGPARGCDHLVMETTYGRAQYRFPSAAEVFKDVVRFCEETLARKETAVLLAYSLGKSQEVLCGLAGTGLPVTLHESVWKITQVYEQCGVVFPPYEREEEGSAVGRVFICPPQAARAGKVSRLGTQRSAIITGWALDPSCRFRSGTDAAFPLSDHADFTELVEMVKRVQPKKVLTLHGFAADFAQTVRRLGIDAQALSEHEQLELSL
jgi:Cft2 family RNA processing exonuclease